MATTSTTLISIHRRLRTRACAAVVRYATLTATLLLFACDGLSDNLPPAAIAPETVGVLRISTSGLDSKSLQESADTLATMMSKSKIPQVVQASGLLQLRAMELDQDAGVKALNDAMTSLRQINAKAIYVITSGNELGDLMGSMSMTMSTIDPSLSGPIVLVQTSNTNSTTDVEGCATQIMGKAVTTEPLGKGWYWLKWNPQQQLPAQSDAAVAQEFDQAIAGLPQSTLLVTMRMTDSIRADIASGLENDAGPLSLFLNEFGDSMSSLNTISGGINFGKDPTIRAAMQFASADSAKKFAQAWNNTTRSAASMLAMMLSAGNDGDDNGPDPKMFTQIAEALDMKQADAQLTLTIDEAGWKKLIP